MKSILALFAAFCLVGSPALAGITALSGTTNGLIGTATQAGTATALQVTVTNTIPVGTLVVVSAQYRATGAISSCTDSQGNTYSQAGTSILGGSAQTALFYSVITTALTATTDTITCTYGAAAGNKLMIAAAFTGAQSPTASVFDATANTSATSTGLISVGPVPSAGNLACNTSAGEVVVSAIALSNPGTPTQDATFNTVSYSGVTSYGFLSYRIVNSNAAITHAPTLTGTSGAWAANIAAFKAITCFAANTKRNLSLMGVGQ